METMLEVIKSIPNLINMQIDKSEIMKERFKEIKFDTIVVVASGSSYNAAFAAKVFSEENLGLKIEIYYPNYFYNHVLPQNINKKNLYVFISQTGKTKTVLETIKVIKKLGGMTLALTESKLAPIAKSANYSFEIGSNNEPYVFRTSGYTLSVVTMLMLLLQIAENNKVISEKEHQNYLIEIDNISKDLPRIIQQAEDWYEDHKKEMSSANAFLFAGGGDLWPTAQEAEMKFMEMVPVITKSYEIEEIIHGPQNSFKKGMVFFLMAEQKEDIEKAERIHDFIYNEITQNIFVISRNIESADFKPLINSIHFFSIGYITFLQVLSYLTATDNNRDLSKTMFPQITKYINKTVK